MENYISETTSKLRGNKHRGIGKLIPHTEAIILSYTTKQKSSKALAAQYAVGQSTILRFLRSQNIDILDNSHSHQVYDLNESFFDSIDTQQKAYCLGLLFADGYNNQTSNVVELTVCEKDRELLDILRNAVNATHPIKYRPPTTSWYKGKPIISKGSYRLSIGNKHLSQALIKLGCTQAKSLTLQFPTLQKHFHASFILGYFDGDGSISEYTCARKSPKGTQTHYACNFVGTFNFLSTLKNIINLQCGTTGSGPTQKGKVYTLQYGGRQQINKLHQFLYQYNIPCLSRKQNVFNRIKIAG